MSYKTVEETMNRLNQTEDLRIRNNLVRTQLNKRENRIKESNANVKKQKKTLMKVRSTLHTLSTKADSMIKQTMDAAFNDIENVLERKNLEFQIKKAECNKLEIKNKQLETTLDHTLEENVIMNVDIQNLQNENRDFKEIIRALTNQNRALTNQNRELTDQNRELTDQKYFWKSQQKISEERVETIQQQFAKFEQDKFYFV